MIAWYFTCVSVVYVLKGLLFPTIKIWQPSTWVLKQKHIKIQLFQHLGCKKYIFSTIYFHNLKY